MIDNEPEFSQYPLVAGHEVIGRVAALGSAAQDGVVKVGQRVGIGLDGAQLRATPVSAVIRSTAWKVPFPLFSIAAALPRSYGPTGSG